MDIALGLSPLHRHMVAVAAVLVVVSVTVLLVSGGMMNMYKKFDLVEEMSDGEVQQCERYYASCTCLGTLSVMESYPPQYVCNGIERCQSMNETVCN